MNDSNSQARCGCCDGVERVTPLVTANRPGLDALAYRVGTHAAFMESMLARLTTLRLEEPDENGVPQTLNPLQDLATRRPDDPSIALLDAWAVVGDVLTFYQERIANEGYLRTATERRSVLELARLVGYRLRPGVAAEVYLAFTLDNGYRVTIPPGASAQSVPGPNEAPQIFETAEPLVARDKWNLLRPRPARPTYVVPANVLTLEKLYFEGIATQLKPNAPLLFVFDDAVGGQFLRRVDAVDAQPLMDRTTVTLQATADLRAQWFGVVMQRMVPHISAKPEGVKADDVMDLFEPVFSNLIGDPAAMIPFLKTTTLPSLQHIYTHLQRNATVLESWLAGLIADLEGLVAGPWSQIIFAPPTTAAPIAATAAKVSGAPLTRLAGLLPSLAQPASRPPANALRLARDPAAVYAAQADLAPRLLRTLQPALADTLYPAWAAAAVTDPPALRSVEALRVKAALFGHNLPGAPHYKNDNGTIEVDFYQPVTFENTWPIDLVSDGSQRIRTIALDAEYDAIKPGGWVAIRWPMEILARGRAATTSDFVLTIHKVTEVATVTMKAHGVSAKSTQLTLDPPWLDGVAEGYFTNETILNLTTVYAQSEPLPLADEPIADDICGRDIELDGLYDGLEAGRWLIISGERTDNNLRGLRATERVMLSAVTQDVYRLEVDGKPVDLPGDKTHTFLQLSADLAYCYRRDTVKIYGNVAKATHGETRRETLGSGDGRRPFQAFTLKQPPLTFVSAATLSGVESSLTLRVNDVEWHEADSLVDAGEADRVFVTRTDDEEKMTVIFGDGHTGARPPTGVENVRAVYRNGIGQVGNVAAEQVSLLISRPLGVKEVINPLRATGGADRDSRDQARRNAPLAVLALDRLVSTVDYADFARTFAGIGKAAATRLTDGRRQVVHLTIAGVDDIPIDRYGDLYRNLARSVRRYGDPYQPIQIDLRRRKLLFLSGRVRIEADYLWEAVAPRIRAALLDRFSFERRELEQDVALSEVISVIQAVGGVAFVDIDIFDAVSEEANLTDLTNLLGNLSRCQFVEARPAWINRTATNPDDHILPAELVYFSPDVPDTIILTEITS